MTIFSLYIYDRHCACVYYQDWHRSKRPKPAVENQLLPGVSLAVFPARPASGVTTASPASNFSSPRNTLSGTSGVVIAVNDGVQQPALPSQLTRAATARSSEQELQTSALPFDEEAKLVYGVILSLRNMIKKLSPREESFVNYRTSTYKLHLFETVSGYKFVMFTDPSTDSMRFVLRQIYAGPFVEYVVRNPLMRMDSRERGIDNEHFRGSVDRLVRNLSVFS